MKTLDGWKKNNQPNRKASILKEHEETLKQLYEEGYSAEQIQSYLKEILNIKVTIKSIYNSLNLKKLVIRSKLQEVEIEVQEVEEQEPEEKNESEMMAILDRLN